MSTKKYREIGERLQDARIKRGWTLDEVQLKLQISKRYLMALEAGEDDDLPGDYYTQSLIKQYANLLDLDIGNRTLKTEPKSIKEWRREHAEVTSRSQKEAMQKKSVLEGLIRQHPWIMASILVLVVWLLAWGAFHDMANRTKSTFAVQSHIKVIDHTKKMSSKKTKTVASSSTKPAKKAKKEDDQAVKISTVANSSDHLKVTLGSNTKTVDLKMATGTSQSWNAVTATAPKVSSPWQGLIAANADKTVSLKKGYTYVLKIGNANGFKGTIGGKAMPKTTTTSTVRSITIEVK
jgi:cytoskeletal protein RodZ